MGCRRLTDQHQLTAAAALPWLCSLPADLAATDSAALILYIFMVWTAPVALPRCKQCQSDHACCTAEGVCQSMSDAAQDCPTSCSYRCRASMDGACGAAQHRLPRVSASIAGAKQLPALLVQVQHRLGWAVAHAVAAPAARPRAIQLRRFLRQDQRGQLLCSRPGGQRILGQKLSSYEQVGSGSC